MKKIINSVLILGFLILAVSAGKSLVNIENNKNVDHVVSKVSADRKAYSSLKELKNDSDIILSGVVQKQLETYNLNRLSTKENPGIIILGTDYEVTVEKYIKGKGDNNIIVTQEGGELNGIIQIMEGRTPIEIGSRYVFFLNKNPDNNKYMFGGDPFKFKLSNGQAKVDTDNKKMTEKFKEKNEKDFIVEIEATQ